MGRRAKQILTSAAHILGMTNSQIVVLILALALDCYQRSCVSFVRRNGAGGFLARVWQLPQAGVRRVYFVSGKSAGAWLRGSPPVSPSRCAFVGTNVWLDIAIAT